MAPHSSRNQAALEPEEEEGTANNSRRSKRPSPTQENAQGSKRTRRGVFDLSGLTDQERRELRRNQRQLHETIRQDKREALAGAAGGEEDGDNSAADEPLEFLQSARQQNNVLFEKVLYTREAVLDAENVDLIAQKYVQQVERLVQVCFRVYCLLVSWE
jgi:hypothetical protein